MTHILVTGAMGTLGQQVVKALSSNPEVAARLMTRRLLDTGDSEALRPSSALSLKRFVGYGVPMDRIQESSTMLSSATSWVQADLKSGEGLGEAVRNIDVIIHCTDEPYRLLEAARSAHVAHIVYISIVGCDRIPLGYYRQKVAEEEAIKASGIPWTILRATQFHALIDFFLRRCSLLPWAMLLPGDWQFQSIAESDVGRRMVDLALASPTGEIVQMGGPQVLSLSEMARMWMTLRQRHRAVLSLRIPGQIAAGYRRGDNTCGTEFPHGQITWEQWVRQRYQGSTRAHALV